MVEDPMGRMMGRTHRQRVMGVAVSVEQEMAVDSLFEQDHVEQDQQDLKLDVLVRELFAGVLWWWVGVAGQERLSAIQTKCTRIRLISIFRLQLTHFMRRMLFALYSQYTASTA